jgi:hypothetical protein
MLKAIDRSEGARPPDKRQAWAPSSRFVLLAINVTPNTANDCVLVFSIKRNKFIRYSGQAEIVTPEWPRANASNEDRARRTRLTWQTQFNLQLQNKF